jgi:hypothetical protein
MKDLGALLAPIPTEEFFDRYWERQPLLIARQKPGYFSGLFSLADLESVIYFTRPRFPRPDELDGYGPNASRTFLRGDDAIPRKAKAPQELTLSDLAGAYREGRTIIVDGMERRWPAIARLCRGLEAELHHLVGANLYFTPPDSQGFPPHHDTHDVFIVQVEGSKRWRLYGSAEQLPLAELPRTFPREELGPVQQDLTLQAGDVLYLPRGVIHEVCTNDSDSLHLTLGIYGYRWADLLGEAVRAAAEREVRLRKLLPPGYLHGRQLEGAFRELLGDLASSACLTSALERIARRFFQFTPALPGGQFAPADNSPLTLDTPLEKRPGLICRVLAEGDTAMLQCQTSEITGPRRIESALRCVAEMERFTARSLPTGLNEQSRLVLVRRLLAEGVLRVVPDQPAASEGD